MRMSDPMMIAIVSGVQETRHGPKVWLNVLRGELSDGDEVLVTHADGTQQSLRFTDVGKHPVTADTWAGIGAVQGSGPFKQEHVSKGTYSVGDLLQTPGGRPVELDASSELAREVRQARLAGSNTAGAHLPDEIVALHVQWVLSHAASHAKGAVVGSAAYMHASDVLAGYGLRDNADRAKLLAAALREGYEPSASARGLASLGAGVINAISFDTPLLVKSIGLALEEGETFTRSYRKSIAVQGEVWRKELMTAGRAIAIGWCKKCADITTLNDALECQRCGKESERFRVVIPADQAIAEQELRDAGPPARHGLLRR
jgi:hypothetical protein